MPDFTPGPWLAHFDDVEGTESTEIRAADGTLIATTYGMGDFPCFDPPDGAKACAEFAANARLIAAATELYEALKAILGISNVEADGLAIYAAHQAARAALAKAEGAPDTK